MDELKRHIINEMMRDRSQPMKNISDAVGRSESYISKIVKELKKSIIAKETIHLNYREVGYTTHAFSLIKLSDIGKDEIQGVAEKLVSIQEAIEVFSIFGEYELYVRWLCPDPETIMSHIEKVLERKQIEKIQTVSFGRCYKREYGPEL